MKLFEMEGFLRGKCVPGDMLVNETNAQYLVRKISGLEVQVKQLAMQLELSVAAERAWETTMMRVCGEDGPLSVAGKFNQLAAENASLKAAFDKPDAWLSWHSIPPTFYEPDRGGEYLEVHEAPGEKNDDGSDSWAVFRAPEIKTPATDTYAASLRAEGVQLYAEKVLAENLKLAKNAGMENTSAVFAHLKHEAESFASQLHSKSEVQS